MKKHLRIGIYFLIFATISFFVIFSCKEEDPLIVTGNIEGTISDMETNAFLQGVNVSLSTNGRSNFIEQSKTTGSDGKFSYKDIEAGSYKLSFKKDGYEDNSKSVTLPAGQTSSSDIGLKPVKPKLTVSKTELNFGTAETNLAFQINNSGKGELKWEVKEGIEWLIVSPSSGTTQTETSSVSVNIDRKNISPGNYERTITVASNGGSWDLLIRVIIEGPKLTVSKSELNFGTLETSLGFQISNSGKGELKWEVKEGIDWLIVSPSSGTTQTETSSVSVNIDRQNISPGNYERTISVTTNGGNAELLIKVVIEGPKLDVSPQDLDFGSDLIKKILLIKNLGVGSLDYTVSSDVKWISIIPNSGTVAKETDQIEVSVSRNGLNYANYSGKINILSKGGNISVDVKMVVPDPNIPQLSIPTKEINFGSKDNTAVLTIKNSGKGILQWSLAKNKTWLDAKIYSGSIPSNQSVDVTLTADRRGLAPNNYSDLIIVTSNGGNESCNVQMEVAAAPVLSFDPGVLDFGYTKDNLIFTIKNSGTGNLNWTLSKNKDWINLSETAGSNQSSITATIDRSKLTLGIFSGQLSIASNGGTANIVVNVEKRNPNTAPKLDFTVTPSSGFLETNFALAITCSDDYTSTDNLLIRWKWQDEDQYSAWGTTKNSLRTFTAPGTKNITVQVKDQDEAITTLTKLTDVKINAKPTASFVLSPTIGNLNTVFSVNASGSSDDITSKQNLQIRWQWESGTSFTGWTILKTATNMYTTAGPKTIKLEVKDESGLTSSITQNLIIDDSEKEPNNSTGQAQPIALNNKIVGSTATSSDYDYYTFTPSENGNMSFSFRNLSNQLFYGPIQILMEYDITSYSGNYVTQLSVVSSLTKQTSNNFPVSRGIQYYFKISPRYADNQEYELSTVFEPLTVSDIGEPNNLITQSTTISLNSTVTALIGFSHDSEDNYVFTPTKDGTLTIKINNLSPFNDFENGDIGECSFFKYGEPNSYSLIAYSIQSYIGSSVSKNIQINKDIKYLIKIKVSSDFKAAPYQLITTFQ